MPEDSRLPPRPSGEIEVREAKEAHIPELVQLEESAFSSDRLTPRSLRRLIESPSAQMMVASLGGSLVGYAAMLTRRRSRIARLYSLAVRSDHAGKGIGARLLAAVERAAFEHGADSVRLEVRIDNAAARRLYEGAGYREFQRVEDYYRDGAAALRLQKDLRAAVASTLQPTSLGRAA